MLAMRHFFVYNQPMIYWAPFLHFYQPPTQTHTILKKVYRECYQPLVKMLLEHRQARVTINICGVLTEMLHKYGATDVLGGIKKLARRRQIEFVESAKYHAILPLIPPSEMRRQIEANHKTNQCLFGKVYRPRGFFPPEMCYSHQMAEGIRKMGYDWLLASGIACPDTWALDFVHSFTCAGTSMKVIYRDDIISNKISFDHISSQDFIREIVELTKDKKNAYIVTAMDAETFGHHIRHWERLFLAKVFEMVGKKIKVVTISELFKEFPLRQSLAPRLSSWSTTPEDLAQKNYYPLWKNPRNRIHLLQWRHLHICLKLVQAAQEIERTLPKISEFALLSRELLDEALHSCQFWWANKERGMWSINMINKGLKLQEAVVLNAFKAIESSMLSHEQKGAYHLRVRLARALATKIRELLLASNP